MIEIVHLFMGAALIVLVVLAIKELVDMYRHDREERRLILKTHEAKAKDAPYATALRQVLWKLGRLPMNDEDAIKKAGEFLHPAVTPPDKAMTIKELVEQVELRADGGKTATADRFTCYDCAAWQSCPFAFDGYNLNGDCLAEK